MKFKDESFKEEDLQDDYNIVIIASDSNNEITSENPITIHTHRKDETERNLNFEF